VQQSDSFTNTAEEELEPIDDMQIQNESDTNATKTEALYSFKKQLGNAPKRKKNSMKTGIDSLAEL
jgi:hypothetical protein